MSIMYSECVCSLGYPVCNTHAPYCHVTWPSSTKFPHIISQMARFQKKKVVEHKTCILIFSTTFVWNIFHSKKTWARYDQRCISVFTYTTHYYCLILMKIEFSWQIFEIYSNIKFHENPSSGSRVVPCGHMDMTKLIVGFRNLENTPKKIRIKMSM